MSKTLALDNLLPFFQTSEKNKKRFSTKTNNTTFRFSLGLIAVNAIVLLSFLLGINSYASTGYEIQKLQNNIDKLTEANQKINLQVAEASSVVNIQTDYVRGNFVPTGSAKYLQLNQYSTNR